MNSFEGFGMSSRLDQNVVGNSRPKAEERNSTDQHHGTTGVQFIYFESLVQVRKIFAFGQINSFSLGQFLIPAFASVETLW